MSCILLFTYVSVFKSVPYSNAPFVTHISSFRLELWY